MRYAHFDMSESNDGILEGFVVRPKGGYKKTGKPRLERGVCNRPGYLPSDIKEQKRIFVQQRIKGIPVLDAYLKAKDVTYEHYDGLSREVQLDYENTSKLWEESAYTKEQKEIAAGIMAWKKQSDGIDDVIRAMNIMRNIMISSQSEAIQLATAKEIVKICGGYEEKKKPTHITIIVDKCYGNPILDDRSSGNGIRVASDSPALQIQAAPVSGETLASGVGGCEENRAGG
jgi:hypothetical protein